MNSNCGGGVINEDQTCATRPTTAMLDAALAQALSFESDEAQSPGPAGATSTRLGALRANWQAMLGQQGSFERGFVVAAGFIVAGLAIGRLVTNQTALLGVAVPMLLLVAGVCRAVWQGVEPGRDWLASRPRQIALGVACAPALTWAARGSLDRSQRAALWTCWSAMIVGLIALSSA